jgi:ATP-dependent exoDNAse (exonuclease V) beta subunit
MLALQQLWKSILSPPKEGLADVVGDSAVQIMTIHQSKGLEFPVVILADTASLEPPDAEPILYDTDEGLALSHRGRPIAACAPETSQEKALAPTMVDRVRQAKRKRAERELARLLYVALTRAKERIFFVDTEGDAGSESRTTLRSLFMRAKMTEGELFSRLMPEESLRTESAIERHRTL